MGAKSRYEKNAFVCNVACVFYIDAVWNLSNVLMYNLEDISMFFTFLPKQ